MSSTTEQDFVDLARTRSRAQFIVACPFPFLLGDRRMETPTGPMPTEAFESFDDITKTRKLGPFRPAPAELVMLAVRKVQETFPSMITVGRTGNNDVVVPDVKVSKFHAFFRFQGDRIELSDAGSRNGTWVGRRQLIPRGLGCAVQLGDTVRFAECDFSLLDAGACWDLATQEGARSDW
jgi:hypothetical protein